VSRAISDGVLRIPRSPTESLTEALRVPTVGVEAAYAVPGTVSSVQTTAARPSPARIEFIFIGYPL
jgi:hypothetical protein